MVVKNVTSLAFVMIYFKSTTPFPFSSLKGKYWLTCIQWNQLRHLEDLEHSEEMEEKALSREVTDG